MINTKKNNKRKTQTNERNKYKLELKKKHYTDDVFFSDNEPVRYTQSGGPDIFSDG